MNKNVRWMSSQKKINNSHCDDELTSQLIVLQHKRGFLNQITLPFYSWKFINILWYQPLFYL